MAKISIAKILGTPDKEFLLPPPKPRKPFTSRFSRSSISIFATIALCFQALIAYRLLVYEAPLPEFPPYEVNETIGLITKWYELLREMKFLGPNAIAYPPHIGEKAINATLARLMGLDERVIDTMEKMPYIDDKTGGWMLERDVIFQDGRFVDYRHDRDIYLSRDPLGHWEIYDKPHKPGTFEDAMMDYDTLFPKSAVPLSIVRGGMWGTGDAIVLDTATNRIHIICTQGDGNRDPFFEGFRWDRRPAEYKTKSPFYGQEIQYVRSAREVLMDFITSAADLNPMFFPGSPYLDSYTSELSPPQWQGWIRDLYKRSNWPSKEAILDHLFPNGTTTPDPFESFRESNFPEEMDKLRHNITVKYMLDWYLPVPRIEEHIVALLEQGTLNEEQATFGRSSEEAIPFNVEGLGLRYLFNRHWELYGKGNW